MQRNYVDDEIFGHANKTEKKTETHTDNVRTNTTARSPSLSREVFFFPNRTRSFLLAASHATRT